MRYLYIIRHGETEYNKLGLVQGRGINTGLNEKGLQQAQSFYRHFQEEGFDKIFTSKLKRTHQTVEPFIQNGIEWLIHEELDEMNWGKYEGKPAFTHFKMEYQELLVHWSNGDHSVGAEGGETPLEVKQRQELFIEKWKLDSSKRSLICMHGRALRILLAWLVNADLSTMESFPHHNLSLYKLSFDGRDFSIEVFNSTEHLHEVA